MYILSQTHICFIFQDTVSHITYAHIIYIQTAICVTIKEPFDHTQIFKLTEASFLKCEVAKRKPERINGTA